MRPCISVALSLCELARCAVGLAGFFLSFGPVQRCNYVSFSGKCLLFGGWEFVVGVGGNGHG